MVANEYNYIKYSLSKNEKQKALTSKFHSSWGHPIVFMVLGDI